MESNKVCICLVDFPKLGLEIGDYFPTESYTEAAIDNAIADGKLKEEVE